MKHATLALLGLATLLSTAACHKAAPVAQKPKDLTPVASTPAQTASRSPQSRPSSSSPTQTASTPRNNGVMTPQERATLNEKLARLNDALFDFDKSAIRDDASTVLKA